jgi:hypothetical protein
MSFDCQHICYVWWACFSTWRVFWKNDTKLARSFNIRFHYTDTVLSLSNNKLGNFVDLHLEIDREDRLRTKMYEKRDDFNFSIVNFSFICSTCQLIRYSGACDFIERGLLLANKLLNQWFLVVKMKSSLQKFDGHHHDLVNRCGVPVPQIATDMFRFFCFYVITIRSFPQSSLITRFVIRLTRRVPHVELKPLTLSEYLSSFRFLVWCVLFELQFSL